MTKPSYEIDYRRSPGLHRFDLADGTPLDAIAVSTWEEFERIFTKLEPISGYIVSPELITSPVPIDQIKQMRVTIEERTKLSYKSYRSTTLRLSFFLVVLVLVKRVLLEIV